MNYPQLFIDCCNECLNPGGSLFLSTINRTGKSFMLGIVAAEHLLRMVPVGEAIDAVCMYSEGTRPIDVCMCSVYVQCVWMCVCIYSTIVPYYK